MSTSTALDANREDIRAAEGAEVHSLGAALAGVNLGNAIATSFGSSQDPIARIDSNSGWGNFSPTDSGSTGGAFNTLASTKSTASTSSQHDELTLFLSQDPSKSLGDSVYKLSNSNLADLKEQHEKPLIKSDSQSSFMLHTTASGSEDLRETLIPVRANSFGDVMPRGRGRTCSESPACSATGTTASSRSVSPYANSSQGGYTNHSDHHSIRSCSQGYVRHRYDTPPAGMTGTVYTDVLGRSVQSPHHDSSDERSSTGGYSLRRGSGSHRSLATLDSHRSPYSVSKEQQRQQHASEFSSGGAASPFETPSHRSFVTSENTLTTPPPQVPPPTVQPQHQQPQVLYMAVPSPDGRGQVLQPVQMMQLPGKPYHFVSALPQQGGQPQLATGTTIDIPSNNSSGSMMVLPPVTNGQDSNPYAATYQASPLASATSENRSRLGSYGGGSESGASSLHQFSLDVGAPQARDEFRSSGNNSRASSPFTTDPSLAALYASPQRPQLDALLGQIRRLSRDQVGCRLVQQALDEESPMAATLILNEGLPFWGEAMVDPFGNYLFQKILEKVSPEERIVLVKSVSPRLVNASLNLHGTRSVQKVVELCALDEQCRAKDAEGESAADLLAQALTPAAARLCIDSHGNHVIQRILLKMAFKHTRFVFDAVAASVGDVARHRHGCCVIQRCLDSPPSESRSNLILRIVENSLELMQDAYGNYVVQYVLDVCPDEDVHAVCESVVGKVTVLAVQKFSSNVMEKCLERCTDRVREHFLHEMSDPDRIRELMMDPFGNYVVQRALSVATHAQAIHLVEAMRPHLTATQTIGPHGQRNGGVRNTAGGRRIIAKICRRFPHFTLSEDSPSEQYMSNKPHGHGHRHHQQQPYHTQHHHHQQPQMNYNQPPMMSPPYSTMVPPPHAQHYSHDPRMMNPPGFMNMPPIQQSQSQQQLLPSLYNMGDSSHYFDQQQFGGGYLDM